MECGGDSITAIPSLLGLGLFFIFWDKQKIRKWNEGSLGNINPMDDGTPEQQAEQKLREAAGQGTGEVSSNEQEISHITDFDVVTEELEEAVEEAVVLTEDDEITTPQNVEVILNTGGNTGTEQFGQTFTAGSW